MYRWCVRSILASALILASTAAPAAAVALEFGERSIEATGITAGGEVVWFSVSLESHNYQAFSVRHRTVTEDEDRDGVVRFELDAAPAPRSAWVVVDLTTGEHAVGSPGRFGVAQRALEPRSAIPDAADFHAHLQAADVLVVRPHVGAWGLRAGDNAGADADGAQNRSIRVPFERFAAVHGNSPPRLERLSANDLLVVIDPRRLTVFVEQVRANAAGVS